MTKVLLRAASGPSVGLGHVRRSHAVARALAGLGVRPEVVLDGEEYAGASFDAAWLDGRRDWTDEMVGLEGARTVLAESRTPARERCDALVYPALHYEPDAWDRAHAGRVHGGAEWVPLAREVLDAEPAPERDLDLLVTFGGSDPNRSTERVLAALAGSGARVAVTIGPHMLDRRAAIGDLAAALPGAEVFAGGDVPVAPMARSRAALTALGTTLYELAWFGVPALILANYEEDRAPLAWYGEHGPHRPLGLASEIDEAGLREALRAHIATATPVCVEGLGGGARRIAELLLGVTARR